jgi:NAD-specific glutamate dehydrogenase
MSKTHVIDGVTYVEVSRKANVGDRIIYTEDSSEIGVNFGDIFLANYIDEDGYVQARYGAINPINYRVLEPLESEAIPDVTDILANLARRVASLEQQLRDTQSNVEKLAEELANVKYLTEEPVTPDESIPQYWAEALIRFYGGNR